MILDRERLDELLLRLDAWSPSGNSFGFHIRFSRPLLPRSTFSDEWNQRYSEKTYIVSDPAVVWGMMEVGTIRWSEIAIPDTMGVFADAADHGLTFGATFATGPRESKTFGTCARGDREFTDAELEEIQTIVVEIHGLFDAGPVLKSHQLDALRALAEGLTYDQACESLGISRTALRNRLAGARRALSAENNAEAVRLAIDKGQLPSGTYTGITKGLPAGPDTPVSQAHPSQP